MYFCRVHLLVLRTRRYSVTGLDRFSRSAAPIMAVLDLPRSGPIRTSADQVQATTGVRTLAQMAEDWIGVRERRKSSRAALECCEGIDISYGEGCMARSGCRCDGIDGRAV